MSKFAPYPEYASTSFGWLNEIPSHWRVKPLWSLFRRIKRTGYESERLLSVYRDYGVIPKDSRDDNHNRASEDLSTYQLVEPGDLAINKMKAWQGSVGVSGHRGIVSPAYFIFKAGHKENSRYIHHLMRCNRYIAGYQSISKGIRVNQWDLDPDKHARMPVVLPPSDEQQAIVDFLDRETARIDTLISKKTRFIELLKEKRQAVITKAVTKGLDDSAEMEDSGVVWLDKVPKSWKVGKLGYLTTKIGSGKTPSGGATVYVQEGVLFLRSQNIYDEGLRLGEVVYISKETNDEMQNSAVSPGDVLLNITGGSIGRSSLVPEGFPKANVNQHVCIIRCPDRSLAEFVHLFFCSHAAKGQIEAFQTGAGREGLNFEQVANFRLAVPSQAQRFLILDHVSKATARIDSLTEKSERSIELLKEHRAALITAAVTGKIDVREAA